MKKKVLEEEEKMFPVVKALPRIDGVDGLMFWCPFCKRWHLHGAGEGHRAAHCFNEESPLDKRGYVLKALTKTEMKKLIKALSREVERRP